MVRLIDIESLLVMSKQLEELFGTDAMEEIRFDLEYWEYEFNKGYIILKKVE